MLNFQCAKQPQLTISPNYTVMTAVPIYCITGTNIQNMISNTCSVRAHVKSKPDRPSQIVTQSSDQRVWRGGRKRPATASGGLMRVSENNKRKRAGDPQELQSTLYDLKSQAQFYVDILQKSESIVGKSFQGDTKLASLILSVLNVCKISYSAQHGTQSCALARQARTILFDSLYGCMWKLCVSARKMLIAQLSVDPEFDMQRLQPSPTTQKRRTVSAPEVDYIVRMQTLDCESARFQIIRSFTTGDLQELSAVLNLFDPITLKRFTHPARGRRCTHRSAFELRTFLQQPFRLCPICSRQLSPQNILVDGFIADILAKTDEFCREVTLVNDGTWTVGPGSKSPDAQVIVIEDSDSEPESDSETNIDNPEPNASSAHTILGSRVRSNYESFSRQNAIVNRSMPQVSNSSSSTLSAFYSERNNQVSEARSRIQNPESRGRNRNTHRQSVKSGKLSSLKSVLRHNHTDKYVHNLLELFDIIENFKEFHRRLEMSQLRVKIAMLMKMIQLTVVP
eukprot:991155_1